MKQEDLLMFEFFDVLDEEGSKTGKIKPREELHRDGDWHKSVHVWIVNDNAEVLLQNLLFRAYYFANLGLFNKF